MKISSVVTVCCVGVLGLVGTGWALDVGGEVFSNPDTITLRLEWGSSFENSKEIVKSGDGMYSFGVNLRPNTKYRVIGKSAPTGWACRAKMVEEFLKDGDTDTHVYCGTTTSDGIRVGSWNLEWYDIEDDPAKKQAIADLINEYNFDVLIANEVLDAASWDDLVQNYLGNASQWDYRISQAGCSLKQVTMWNTNAVTFDSGFDLNCETSNCIIDENSSTWDDCAGRRPYVASFTVNDTAEKFTTATIHFKAKDTSTDCQLRKDQVDTFVQWVDWAGMGSKNFMAVGDFNDTLPGTGICSSIDTLDSMELHSQFWFATAQPDYHYWYMMGNGLVTFDTKSFQSTLDHFWVSDSLFDLLETTVDTFGNKANAAQANMYFTDWGEPDHNPPYVAIGSGGGSSEDTTAPTTSITSPSDGDTVSGTILVAADASDDVGVSEVEFYLDGALAATDTSSPWEWSWDTTTVADGSHTLEAKAYDAAGNVGSSGTITVTVDNSSSEDTTAPSVSITSPNDGDTVSGTILVSADASDDVGVSQVEFYLDGALAATDTSEPWEWSWDTTTVADGSHTLEAKAYDDAANVGSSGTITVTVDNSGGITLSASGYKVKGLQKADLSWDGATSTDVDVYRDGAVIATTENDGFYTDNIDARGGGSYTYQVCESGTTTCSNEATVTF